MSEYLSTYVIASMCYGDKCGVVNNKINSVITVQRTTKKHLIQKIFNCQKGFRNWELKFRRRKEAEFVNRVFQKGSQRFWNEKAELFSLFPRQGLLNLHQYYSAHPRKEKQHRQETQFLLVQFAARHFQIKPTWIRTSSFMMVWSHILVRRVQRLSLGKEI